MKSLNRSPNMSDSLHFLLRRYRSCRQSRVNGWTDGQATDPNYWAKHLRMPVQFSGAVTALWENDPTQILIELGPRKTLATLAKQHATNPKQQLALPTMSDKIDEHAEWRAALNTIAQLWSAGVEVPWETITGDASAYSRKHVTLPTYPFERQRYFIDPPKRSSPITSSASRNHSMNRIANIIADIEQVFENTSGFDLQEFDGETTFF